MSPGVAGVGRGSVPNLAQLPLSGCPCAPLATSRRQHRPGRSAEPTSQRACGRPDRGEGTTELASALTRGACVGDSASAEPVEGFEVEGGGFIQTDLGDPYRHAHRPTAGLVEALDTGTPVGGQTARHIAMGQPRMPDVLGPYAG